MNNTTDVVKIMSSAQNCSPKILIGANLSALFGAKQMLRQMGRHTVKTVRKATPKLASTAVIIILIASIFPLALFTIAPSTLPRAAATAPNIIFHDGFESGNATKWDSTSSGSGGTISYATDYKIGSYSFKLSASQTGSYGYAQGSANFTSISNTVWMQMYFRINSYPSGSGKFVEIFELRNSTGAIAGLRLYSSGAGLEKLELKRYVPVVAWDHSSDLNIATNTWYRLEFMFNRSSTNGAYRVFLNGTEVITTTGLNTNSNSVPTKMRVGVTSNTVHSSSSWAVWVDDVSVSNTTRIDAVIPADPIFSNGFEQGTNSTNWDWKSSNYGTISNDNTIFYGGIRSFKFGATAYNGYGYVHGSSNFNNLDKTMWMQMYVRINSYPSGSGKMVEVFEIKGSSGSIASIRLYSSGAGQEKIELKRYFPSAAYDHSGDLNVLPSTWHRLEFKLYRDSTNGHYSVMFDGATVINITNVNTADIKFKPTSMNVGATASSHSSSSWTLWVDDVSVSDTTRIDAVIPADPVFNDGFELTPPGGWDLESTQHNGTISYDSTIKANGTKSFKFAATQKSADGFVKGSKNFTQIGNTFSVQMYLRISAYPSGTDKKVEVFELKNSTGGIVAAIRLYSPSAGNEQIQLKRFVPSVQYDYSSDLDIAANTWFKLKFAFYRNSTSGYYKVYINDSQVISVTNVNTGSSATIPDGMLVGVPYSSHSISSWTLWVDSVSVSRLDPWLYDRRYVAGYMTADGCPPGFPFPTYCGASEAKAAISFPNTTPSVIPSGEFLEGSINLKASDHDRDGVDYSIRATHNLYPNGTHAVLGEMWETCDGIWCNTAFPYKTLLYRSLLRLDGLPADQTIHVRIRVIGDDRVRWWYSYNGASWTEYGIYTPPTTFNEYLQIGTNRIWFGPYLTAYGFQFGASSSSLTPIPGPWSVRIAQPSYNRSLTWTVVSTAKILQGTHSYFSQDWKISVFPYIGVWANYPTADQSVTFYWRGPGYLLPDHDTLWGG